MKIIFVLGSYYPFASAVGNCVSIIATELAKRYSVIVVCVKNEIDSLEEENYNLHLIRRITTRFYAARLKFCNMADSTNVFLKYWGKINIYILRIVSYFKSIFSQENIDQELVSSYTNCLKKMNFKNEQVVLIPCCFPFESVVASIKYKKEFSNASILPYLFDRFADSSTLHRNEINKQLKWKRHLFLEELMLKNCKKVLFIESWREHLLGNFSKYSCKFIQVEHPLLCDINVNKIFEFDR